MRTIKFRAKVKYPAKPIFGKEIFAEGEWVFGELHTDAIDPHIHCGIGKRAPIDMETVGQCIGLRDMNGKDIYEGDIVKSGNFVYQVVYEGKRFASFALRRKEDMFLHYFGEAMEAKDCEVIGNTHDNPELLNQKSNE